MDGFSMREFLRSIGFPLKPSFVIDSRESLEKAAETFGLLPFFSNNIKGLSVEEMCAPGLLFGGNFYEGCWEWKGPVIRSRTSAYGKFFRRKAGFISLDLLPDFLNFRRNSYFVKPASTDEMLLDIIKENDSLTSTELKRLIFGKSRRTRWDELPENDLPMVLNGKSKSLESPLQRLQMGGWIIISDFEYKLTKRGERYGWGVARYSTPEIIFGELIENYENRSPSDSFNYVIEYMRKKFPFISRKSLETLLK